MLHPATQDGERTKLSLIRHADIMPGGCRPPRLQLTAMSKTNPSAPSDISRIFVTRHMAEKNAGFRAALLWRQQRRPWSALDLRDRKILGFAKAVDLTIPSSVLSGPTR
jgi:hypothetical protein